MEFDAFYLWIDNLIEYFAGSFTVLALVSTIFVVALFLARGLKLSQSLVLALPVIVGFAAAGMFVGLESGQWVANTFLLVVSILYGLAIVKLMG